MDQNLLLHSLQRLNQAEFEVLRARVGVREGSLPGVEAPVNARSEALLKALEKRPGGLERIGRWLGLEGAVLPCPYLGLNPFTEHHTHLFFGRQELVAQSCQTLLERGRVVVMGHAGVGKSSLTRAGLLTEVRLRRPGWLPITMVPGRAPLRRLAAALIPAMEVYQSGDTDLAQVKMLTGKLTRGELSLTDLATAIVEHQPHVERVLLVVDRWEELYTITEREGEAFITQIVKALEQAPEQFSLALTLRSDFYSRVLSNHALTQAFRLGIVDAKPLSREQLREVIEGPAQVAGLSFEPGLVEHLLDEAEDLPDALPMLEVTLELLWRGRGDDGLMKKEVLDHVGGLRGAISWKANDAYDRFEVSERKQARKAFMALVKPGRGVPDTRRRIPTGELGSGYANVIPKLASLRLLVVSQDGGTGQETVEVMHEALIHRWDRLRTWVEDERKTLEVRDELEQAARAWIIRGELKEDLPGESLLGLYEVCEQVHALSPYAERYLFHLKEQRRDRELQEQEVKLRKLNETQLNQVLKIEELKHERLKQDQENEKLKEEQTRELRELKRRQRKRLALAALTAFVSALVIFLMIYGWMSSVLTECRTILFSTSTTVDERHAALERSMRFAAWMGRKTDLAGSFDTHANMKGMDLSGIDLRDAVLVGADFEGANLQEANLQGANLVGAHLQKTDLRGALLDRTDLKAADFEDADLRKTRLRGADLHRADLKRAKLLGTDMTGAYLAKADLEDAHYDGTTIWPKEFVYQGSRAIGPGAQLRHRKLKGYDLRAFDLRGVGFQDADLTGANLNGVSLEGCDLSGAILKGADLTGVNLKNAYYSSATVWPEGFSHENSGAIGPGAFLNNVDFKNADLTRRDLTGSFWVSANLSNAKLVDALLKGANLQGTNLQGADLSEAALSAARLYGADLRGANLTAAQLDKGDMDKPADLSGALLERAILANANMEGVSLKDANLIEAVLTEADLEGADLRGADLSRSNFAQAHLLGIDLRGVKVSESVKEGAITVNFSGAAMQKSDLKTARIAGADFSGAQMEDSDFSEADLKGTLFKKSRVMRGNFTGAELQNADFTEARMFKANLKEVNLSGAKFTNAKMVDIELQGANLQGANLQGALLKGAHLKDVDLRGADLRNADLRGSDLRNANVEGALLDGTDLRGSRLQDVDLKSAIR